MRGPWYISAAAVRDYLSLCRRQIVDEGQEWDQAEDELIALATEIVASGRQPASRDHGGRLQYRLGRPRRWYLVVDSAERPEGDRPSLIAVTDDRHRRPHNR